MRRLRDFQPVQIVNGLRRIEAVVVATTRDQVTLAVSDRDARRAAALSGDATLHFEDDGRFIALAGRVLGRPGGTVYFRIEDTASQDEPRGAARLPIGLDITLAPTGGDGDVLATRTIDVSESGVRVKATGLPPAVTVVLRLPGEDAPLSLAAEVVRTEEQATALRFCEPSPDDAQRLRALVLTVRRSAVRRR